MEKSLRYLTAREGWGINQKVLHAQGGGSSLLRDRGILEGAVARPQMHAHYAGADLIDQAITLIVGLALAHPFVDGNKRTAFIAGDAYLRQNGLCIDADGREFGEELRSVVDTTDDRETSEQRFSIYVRQHVIQLTPDGLTNP